MALDAIARQSTYVTRTRPPRRGARVAADEFERLLTQQEQDAEHHDGDDDLQNSASDTLNTVVSEHDESSVVQTQDAHNSQRVQGPIEEGHIDEHV